MDTDFVRISTAISVAHTVCVMQPINLVDFSSLPRVSDILNIVMNSLGPEDAAVYKTFSILSLFIDIDILVRTQFL